MQELGHRRSTPGAPEAPEDHPHAALALGQADVGVAVVEGESVQDTHYGRDLMRNCRAAVELITPVNWGAASIDTQAQGSE